MTADPSKLGDAIQYANAARATAIFAPLGDVQDTGSMAAPGLLRAHGRDAASFLHAQLTNQVKELEPGNGNLNARVSRKGKLEEIFSLHCLPSSTKECNDFWLILPSARVSKLQEALDLFLFADQLELTTCSDDLSWWSAQGPNTEAWMVDLIGDEVPSSEHGITFPARGALPQGSAVIRRSLTGDPGFLIAAPASARDEAHDALLQGLKGHDIQQLTGDDFSAALEVLRLETGMVRVDLDTPGRDRLLPETCLEQQLVSYTKGCYLGQEVIARVRTYGAIKFALRAILIGNSPESIAMIQPSGENVILEGGKNIGQFISRSWSPARSCAVALAYLDRDHRTPGATLRFEGRDGILEGTVALLPLYQAADQSARAQNKYDEGIRVFADGHEAKARGHMEEALRLDPSFTDAYEALGLMLGRSQKYHEAIDFFRRLEEVAPKEPMVNTNLSVYYMKVGDKEGAEAEAAKAMQKEMLRSRGADLSVAEVEQQQRDSMREQAQRKIDMFSQVLEIDAEDPVALYGLGNAYAVLEDWQTAKEMYTRGVAAQKDNSAMYLGLGKTLESMGETKDAIEIYRRGMEVASKRGDLMPLKDMENRVLLLSAMKGSSAEMS